MLWSLSLLLGLAPGTRTTGMLDVQTLNRSERWAAPSFSPPPAPKIKPPPILSSPPSPRPLPPSLSQLPTTSLLFPFRCRGKRDHQEGPLVLASRYAFGLPHAPPPTKPENLQPALFCIIILTCYGDAR
ncbi:hypothetical protein QBC39DRAFT_138646 [Podospora conica]|nr:hypothetical protein QBC39DRAFT_138646 [Schizothecium conicum]